MSEHPGYEPEKPKNKEKRFIDPNLPMIYNESLMEIFGFDQMALETNRRGFVTNQQKQGIASELKEEADSMWLMVTILLGVSVLLAIIFTLQGYPPLPLVIGAGLVIGGILAVAYGRQITLRKDVERLRTYRVEGVPMVSGDYVGDRSAKIQIADQELPITQRQASALREFALPMMRFYYAANSKQILSAEVLQQADIEKLKVEDMDEDEHIIYAERQLEEQSQQETQK